MPVALRVTKQDSWLVRLNLVAYGDYRLCCAASHDMTGPRLQRFIERTDVDLAEKLFDGADYVHDFLLSRRAGYMVADDDRSNKFAVVHYFRACGGSDEVMIDYDRVAMDPKDLRSIIENFGPLPGALAALSKAESIADPIIYGMDPMGDTEIFASLAAAAKSVFDIWRGSVHH
jgi:hypothetical protein